MNYYNEHDPKAAAWLRELIKAGLIADGIVDERDIQLVHPADLLDFKQCHFFAGIGGWSLALRLAGWPDDEPVWTGSCPCQPFSVAGAGKGTADKRHLWPDFKRLIEACKPAIAFGEQVASKAGREWLAGVFADLEGMGYQRAGADLCAAGVGAPHIRQRIYWLANANECSNIGSVPQLDLASRTDSLQENIVRMGNSYNTRPQGQRGLIEFNDSERRKAQERHDSKTGFWGGFDTLNCTDGKARRIESGSFPLVAGLPKGMVYSGDIGPSVKATGEARTMRLRGYGNALTIPVAVCFIKACEIAIQEIQTCPTQYIVPGLILLK